MNNFTISPEGTERIRERVADYQPGGSAHQKIAGIPDPGTQQILTQFMVAGDLAAELSSAAGIDAVTETEVREIMQSTQHPPERSAREIAILNLIGDIALWVKALQQSE